MRCWIAFGGNVGDVRAAFALALARLTLVGRVGAASSLYDTPPWGPVQQGRFLNAVVEFETPLAPHALLDLLNAIERESERTRDVRWGPRTLDLDLIAIEGRSVDTDRLTVPHPRAAERPFVTVPLAEIAPVVMLGSTSARELAEEADEVGMEIAEGPDWASQG